MKKSFLIIIIVCGILLTGCAKMTDLTDNESDKLAEYMAGTVLSYAKNYDEALIYPEEEKDATKELADATDNTEDGDSNKDAVGDLDADSHENIDNNSNTNASNNTTPEIETGSGEVTSVSLKNLFHQVGDNQYTLSYTGYEDYTSYPSENDYFTIEPAEGNKLVLFNFSIKNITKKSVKVNMLNKKIQYTLKDTTGKSYNSSVSLLSNDIHYFNETLKANKSKKAVLVFEISKDIALKDLSLFIDYNEIRTVISMDN